MADAPTLSPELSRSVSALARTLVAAARSWALYPPDHPAVRGALGRLRIAIAEAANGQAFSFGVTPDSLLIEGIAVFARDAGAVNEAAAWLHDRDILQITFAGDVAVPSLQRFLGVLSEDSRVVRQCGGPAKVWAEASDSSIVIEQVDFSQMMQDREVTNPARRKDDIWRSIVRSVLDRRKPLDEATQARMLEIAGDVVAIGELARDVIAPHHTPDGSPMLTSQAAAVVAAYRHLVGIVDVLSPERRQAVITNLATATATLHPQVVLQMLHPSTQIVSIADVYDALRSNRIYRKGLPSDRIRAIMTEKDSPAFNAKLLRRFINLIGLFPIGTLVRMATDELAVVTHEHPTDPFRPQVKIVRDRKGDAIEEPHLVNTWERNDRGDYPWAVVEAVDAEVAGLDPLAFM